VRGLHHDRKGLSFSYVYVSGFSLLFLLFVKQVFDFVIALHCSGTIQIIIWLSFISIATSRSYFIVIFVHHSLHKSHGMVYNHALVDYSCDRVLAA